MYSDEAAAQAKGHPSLPVPPTYLFGLAMAGPAPLEACQRLGVDYARVLHGEQHFVCHRLAFAGETLRLRPRIADLIQRKGGVLGFIVLGTRVEGMDGAPVAELRGVMVVVQRPSGAGQSVAKALHEPFDLALGGERPEVVRRPRRHLAAPAQRRFSAR